MNVTYYWHGLSSDTKPTGSQIPIGALAMETDTGNEDVWTGSLWKRIGTNGAGHVLTGTVGTPQSFGLNAIAIPTDVAANRISDAIGYKAFRVRPVAGKVAAVTALVYGWSTSVSDFTNVNAACTALIADIVTPASAGQANENTKAILPIGATGGLFDPEGWVRWDGVTKIKTILVKSAGADQGAVIVEVVV